MSDIVIALETALRHQEHRNDQVARPLEVIEEMDRGKVAKIEEYDPDMGGLLVVIIHKGNDLERRRNLFVFLRIGYDMRSTTKVSKNQNPVWEETFKFTLDKPAKSVLHLVVEADSSYGNNLKDNLGDVDIRVADVVKEKHMNYWYKVGTGRLHVELLWEPSAVPVKTKSKFMQFMTSTYNYTFHKGS
ncbi:hypothetical protein QVD17_21180 [Tagetes erecta]|uniref:C2 domain-containing protein n=1 Tax=Tagetes erecta TaxID=13708 RepID=A0AAD8KMK6_TARER|nr:hypothetical protein QVD17_21180 [Tagetes erecta]